MLWYPLTVTLGLAVSVTSWSPEKEVSGNHVRQVKALPAQSHLTQLDVVCSKEYMTVNMQFDQPFQGIVFSHAPQSQQRCVHVGPHAGVREASFRIRYDSCGTIEDSKGHFHENTIVVQFEVDILEAWDEAKKLRCEWLTDFEKSSSKPAVHISELDVVELNFQGDDIECWMEIQEGKGPWSRQLEGLVLLGSPLTLVIAINDHNKEFDMKVKQCHASDGAGFTIPLTDEHGCVLRSSLLTPFLKVRDFSSKATLLSYSYLYAFKFPDNLDVYIRCSVQVCRHGCVESCPRQPISGLKPSPRDPENIFGAGLKLKETTETFHHQEFFRDQETKHHVVKIPSKFITNPEEVPHINNMNEIFQNVNVKVATYNESRYLKDETHEENVHPFSKDSLEKVHVEVGAKVPIGSTYSGYQVHFDDEQINTETRKQKKIHPSGFFHSNSEPLPEPQSHVSSETHSKQIHWDDGTLKHEHHDQPKEFFPHRPPVQQQKHSVPVPEPEPEPSSVHSPELLSQEQIDQSYEDESGTYHLEPTVPPYILDHPRGFSSVESHASGHWNIPQPEPEPFSSSHKFRSEHDGAHQEPADIPLLQPKPLTIPPFLFAEEYPNGEPVLRYNTPTPATDPAPVYIPKSQMSSMNNSKQMMMMGMSSMKTMYPPSYMSSMSMLSKLRHHHYPYPVPQFSPNKAMAMLNVVADRRNDESVDDLVLTGHRQEENTEAVQVTNRQPITGFALPVQPRTFENGEEVLKSKIVPVPRILRVKRSEPIFGVQQKFRVISPADLAFEFNATVDSAKILNGRREDIVYGVCMSTAGLGASVSILLFLTGSSMVIATVLFHKHQQMKMKRPKTTSYFSGVFNGQLEHVYKARPSSRGQKGPKIIEIS